MYNYRPSMAFWFDQLYYWAGLRREAFLILFLYVISGSLTYHEAEPVEIGSD